MVRRRDDQPSLKLRPDKEDAAQRRRWTSNELNSSSLSIGWREAP
jgi:hypothetical protein